MLVGNYVGKAVLQQLRLHVCDAMATGGGVRGGGGEGFVDAPPAARQLKLITLFWNELGMIAGSGARSSSIRGNCSSSAPVKGWPS